MQRDPAELLPILLRRVELNPRPALEPKDPLNLVPRAIERPPLERRARRPLPDLLVNHPVQRRRQVRSHHTHLHRRLPTLERKQMLRHKIVRQHLHDRVEDRRRRLPRPIPAEERPDRREPVRPRPMKLELLRMRHPEQRIVVLQQRVLFERKLEHLELLANLVLLLNRKLIETVEVDLQSAGDHRRRNDLTSRQTFSLTNRNLLVFARAGVKQYRQRAEDRHAGETPRDRPTGIQAHRTKPQASEPLSHRWAISEGDFCPTEDRSEPKQNRSEAKKPQGS